LVIFDPDYDEKLERWDQGFEGEKKGNSRMMTLRCFLWTALRARSMFEGLPRILFQPSPLPTNTSWLYPWTCICKKIKGSTSDSWRLKILHLDSVLDCSSFGLTFYDPSIFIWRFIFHAPQCAKHMAGFIFYDDKVQFWSFRSSTN
jgi:hypothetical protein